MVVIKKDGRLQELNSEKIKISIENATQNVEVQLNESDLNIIVKDVIKVIETTRSDYGNTSSYEIIGAIIDVLKKDGFESVISAYIGYKK